MKNDIKVSIVVPVYNAENFLHLCIDSLLSQTLKEIEIVTVNDCSTDGSLELLYNYSKKDNRVTIINQEKNQGFEKSLFNGVKKAKGEFILWLGHDDSLYPSSLETMYQKAIQGNYDLIVPGVDFYDGIKLKKVYFTYISRLSNKILKNYFLNKIQVDTAYKLIKKNIFLNTLQEEYKTNKPYHGYCSDISMMVNMLLHCKIYCVKERLIRCNEVNKTSLSSSTVRSNSNGQMQKFLLQVKEVKKILLSSNIYEEYEKYYIYFCFIYIKSYLYTGIILKKSKYILDLISHSDIISKENLNILKNLYPERYALFLYQVVEIIQSGTEHNLIDKLIKLDFVCNDIEEIKILFKKYSKNYNAILFDFITKKLSIKEINIYGAGGLFEQIYSICKKNKIKIKYLITTDADKKTETSYGFKAIPLKTAYQQNNETPLFIASYTYHHEILSLVEDYIEASKNKIQVLNDYYGHL